MITSSSSMCKTFPWESFVFPPLGIFLKDTEGLPSFIENISPIPGSYVNIKSTTTAVRVNEYWLKVGFKRSQAARPSMLYFQPSTRDRGVTGSMSTRQAKIPGYKSQSSILVCGNTSLPRLNFPFFVLKFISLSNFFTQCGAQTHNLRSRVSHSSEWASQAPLGCLW